MGLHLDGEIRTRLGRYVRGEDSLSEFREWFTPATWDVHLSENSAAVELAYRITHLLAEYVTGNIAESTLRARLRPMQETYVLTYGDLEADLRTQLTGAVRREPFSVAGTRP